MNAHSLDESGAQDLWAISFCRDTYGPGHARRTLTLSRYFQAIHPGVSRLILKGSPAASALTYPDCGDLIESPPVTKDRAGDSPSLTRGHMPFDGIRRDVARLRHLFLEGSVQS